MKRYPQMLACLVMTLVASAIPAAEVVQASKLPAASGPDLVLTSNVGSLVKKIWFATDTQESLNGYGDAMPVFDMGIRRSPTRQTQDTQAVDDSANKWLTVLAAIGLVALQLRRKHKSLPKRPFADSEH